jgi:hypothetical protein
MQLQPTLRVVMIAAALIGGMPALGRAQCAQPNGNDQVSDVDAIQCLLDQGGTIVLNADVTFGYYIDRTLTLSKNGTILMGTTANNYRALLLATPALDVNHGPILQAAEALTNYTISNIWFYGNRFNRPSPFCADDRGANFFLRGAGAWAGAILLDNIASDAAPCGTSMNVTASNFEIRNSWFDNNGQPEDQGGPFADGLTVWRCDNGYIHNNHFRDNTDIDLVVGGGPNCRVQNNDIQHFSNYGFGGIHVGWFPGGDGNHSGSVYSGNTITAGVNKLAFGIVVGTHPWNTTWPFTNSGDVINNPTISGAVINLAVEASFSSVVGQVTGNNPTGPQGNNGLGSCSISRNYTVYQDHTVGMSKQLGWFELQYDDGVCTPR